MNEHSAEENSGGGRKASAVRKAAEWVTLGCSSLLILVLAGFLLWSALQPHPPFVPATARPLWELVEQKDKKYFLPIQIQNRGRQTLRELNIEVSFQQDGKAESRDVLVDYLGEGSRQTIFVVFDADPKTLNVKAAPTFYRLD
jgi:uncharacterized protein (TIGR02588 family)